MKIEANDKEIRDIFSLGYFKIPRFQRPYSWEEDQVRSFWNDIIQEDNDQYFIGSMVVYQDKKPYFGIVDGQQRLTTITLIFSAIRNLFLVLEEENLAKGIHLFIEKPNIDNEEEFILNSETSFPYLHDYIQSYKGSNIECNVGAEEKNLKEAFEFITEKLKELLPQSIKESVVSNSILFDIDKNSAVEKLKDLRNRILSLKLVFIQLDNEDDAYLIFETLNARGRDLTTADLVKNHLLKKLKSNSASLDSAKQIWNEVILRKFDDADKRDSLNPFLYHFWLSSKSYTTEKKLFPALKEVTRTKEDAQTILYELQAATDLYLSIISPSNHLWRPEEAQVRKSLEALKLFNVKQQLPMILSLIKSHKEGRMRLKRLSKLLSKIEFFHFVFNAVTSQRSSGAISTHYSKHAILLNNAQDNTEVQTTIDSLLSGLERKLPSYSEFESSFIELNYTSRKSKSKSVIQYSLQKLLGDYSNGLAVDYGGMSIEHLVPEVQINENIDEEYIGNIGNLILIDKKTNNEELSDNYFEVKKKILIEKRYPLDSILIESKVWNSETINKRAKLLAKKLFENNKFK
ncbi:protein of unknown function DUF262 [[Leptolyngbya] sp. PCC 7376]|uniref:DUF262 domain-containing protein n=1 Tax=[Leptolyngbya] sp. PCC 7376 TaxID=111781 RepID=UPI00029F2BD7|nr:DUF262 domain-containing protein [[Leptolyngbya] sp. PCC 7376]AFY37345.1 protein of unknown function DUF262 [[Leptolyngbya] sp. PCC 7376]